MAEAFQQWLRRLEKRLHPPPKDLDLIEQGAGMAGPVRLVADSGCDLSPALVEQHGIVLVPLIVRFGTEVLPESELSRDAFWQRARGPFPPQTSQPSTGAFEQAFAPLVEAGAAVLCLTVTSRHSGTYNSAWAAAQSFAGRVLVWDSRSLSIGMGLQALEAAVLVREGRPLWEIVRRVAEVRRGSRMTILLDTVEYLRRGGRMDGMIAVLDRLVRVLKVRPLLRMVDGELRVLGAARSFRLGLERLRGEARAARPLHRLGVGHTRRPEEARWLAEAIALEAALPAEALLVAEVGPALASHGGPGLVGIVTVGRGD